MMLDGVHSAVESSDSITFELNESDISINGFNGEKCNLLLLLYFMTN